ncbi:heavy metal translocating P-type ATPase [Henriciella mobilis]|uniref:Heavy metal translocating P-type ATPase n=1 Tax=Henriciella mobilis TaxID=2305467 RepID=A0A399R525_9PROT|nr:heavy metal translocating P-type ATPase [Henriciella mobilis]RIJ26390.1 heavy metal translocating P-type ATPase [Henriciella mobilis]
MTTLTDVNEAGCPSGLAPATAGTGTDVSAFVSEKGGVKSLSLSVRGAKCAGCLSKIEGGIGAMPGVSTARLNLSSGRLDVRWSGDLDANAIAAKVADLGYGVSAFDPDKGDAAAKKEERDLLIAMGVAAFAAANVMLLSVSVWAGHGEMGETTRRAMHAISGAIAIPAALFSGRVFFKSAWNVLKRGHANMDVPISLAVLLALGVSVAETIRGGEHAYFDASVMLLFFLLIGRFLDARLRRRTHAAAHDLAALQSHTVTRLDATGVARSVRASEVSAGDTILIAPGERLAVDIDVIDGKGEVDESLVSGESLPRAIAPGARIFAGSVNLGQSIRGRAISPASDSLLADIGRMLEAGEQRRSAYRRIADKAVSLYVPLVHTTAALTFIGWMLAGAGVREALLIAVSTLIITCPCALALAAPVVQVVTAGRLFRKGVYLKSGDALERLATADHVVFDKTGTLTLGDAKLIAGSAPREIVLKAARLARASRHPLSRAIVAAAGPGPVADHVTEHAGLGLEAEIDGETARLGSADWVGADDAPEDGKLHIWYSEAGGLLCRFDFEDALRPESEAIAASLKARGLGLEILSGDRAPAVEDVANRLGIKRWTAGASPAQKAARLDALKAEGRKVLMIGDGLNDAGSLALAHASLAPGGAMDVSQSASDAVYTGTGLGAILAIIDTARGARIRMLQNFSLAALYNMVAVPIAVAGFATPLVAAIAMSASSVIVTLNAIRPTRSKEPIS